MSMRVFSIAAAVIVASGVQLSAASPQTTAPRTKPVDARTREIALQHHREGWQALMREDFEGARDAFLKAIEVVREIPTAHYGLGKSHMGLKEYDDAIRSYTDCRDLYQQIAARATVDQLEINQRRQDQLRELEDAVRESQRGAATQSASQQARQARNVSELAEQMRYVENRLASGTSVSVEEAVPPEVYLALGSAYFRAEKMSDAEREYRNAVKVKPNFGEAWNNLAVIALLDERIPEAEDAVKRAEKAGFKVNPQLKEDIKTARK